MWIETAGGRENPTDKSSTTTAASGYSMELAWGFLSLTEKNISVCTDLHLSSTQNTSDKFQQY
jgi:hypothetical protein